MQSRQDIALVPVEQDLDVTTVDDMRTSLNHLIDGGCRRIILNMAGASYVDSAGMAMLLSEIRRMRSLHGLLSLTNVSDQVLSLLKRARLVDFVPVSSCSPHQEPELDPSVLPLWRTVIPIECDDLSLTRANIERLIEQVPLSQDEVFDAVLAAGEAVGNAVDHTDGTGALVTVVGYPDRVVIEVSDCGPGFDPNDEAYYDNNPLAERGRGLRLMNLLSDSVSIKPKPSGNGMLVRIVKLAHAATD